jgi:type IV pilus biogenesis protein PilP
MNHRRSRKSITPAPESGADAVVAGLDMPARRGKPGVVIVAAVLFLLVAASVAGAVYVFILGGPSDETPILTPGTTQETPAPAAAEAAPTEPPPVPLKRVFTFRDVFAPLIKPAPEPTPASAPVTGSTTTTTTAPVNDGTLTLRDVVSVDGEPAAVLALDGQIYTLKAGESISGTPWKVLSISGQTVVMLFGDVQVTLSVGQGVTPSTK